MDFFKLSNPIKKYSWGSKTAIQSLFGIANKNQEPQAEIWMGAHPTSSSSIYLDGNQITLKEFIDFDANLILSEAIANQFGELPYLFKVLAAEKALSIQVHPSKQEAEEGYAQEELLGVELSSFERNYRDSNHKPELVYALTNYQAMNGFRDFDKILELFNHLLEQVDIPPIQILVDEFTTNKTPNGLEVFFIGLLSLKGEDKVKSIQKLIEFAEEFEQPNVENDLGKLIIQLYQCYGNDIGVFAPLVLNVITLKPGEAMFLDARTPHAYIRGTGLEIMANSDNVLRAGLTPKYIDISELAKCTSFKSKPAESLILKPDVQGNKYTYPVPVPDFKFDCFNKVHEEKISVRSPEILFAIDSNLKISNESGDVLKLKKGESVFIPAYVNEYFITSEGRVARAYC